MVVRVQPRPNARAEQAAWCIHLVTFAVFCFNAETVLAARYPASGAAAPPNCSRCVIWRAVLMQMLFWCASGAAHFTRCTVAYSATATIRNSCTLVAVRSNAQGVTRKTQKGSRAAGMENNDEPSFLGPSGPGTGPA